MQIKYTIKSNLAKIKIANLMKLFQARKMVIVEFTDFQDLLDFSREASASITVGIKQREIFDKYGNYCLNLMSQNKKSMYYNGQQSREYYEKQGGYYIVKYKDL